MRHSVPTHNRARLIAHDVAGEFFRAVVDLVGEGGELDEQRPLHRGRDVDRGCGEPEELPKARSDDDDASTPPDDQGNPTRGLSRREAKQRDARVDDGSGREALRARARVWEAKLSYSAHALMENRNGLLVGLRARHRGRLRRAPKPALEARRQACLPGQPPHHPRRGQGLRHARLRRRVPRSQHHAACRAEGGARVFGARCANVEAKRLQ